MLLLGVGWGRGLAMASGLGPLLGLSQASQKMMQGTPLPSFDGRPKSWPEFALMPQSHSVKVFFNCDSFWESRIHQSWRHRISRMLCPAAVLL